MAATSALNLPQQPTPTYRPWQTTDAAAAIERAIAIATEMISETLGTAAATAQMHPKAATAHEAHDEIAETAAEATATALLLAAAEIETAIGETGATGTVTVAATGGMIATLAPTASRPKAPVAHRQAPGETSTLVVPPSLPQARAELPARKRRKT